MPRPKKQVGPTGDMRSGYRGGEAEEWTPPQGNSALLPAPSPTGVPTMLEWTSPRWERLETVDGREAVLDLDRVSAVLAGHDAGSSVIFVNGGSVIVRVPFAKMVAKLGMAS